MREAMGNAFVPGAVALDPVEAAMVERRGRVLGPAYRLQYERPLHIVRGEGVHLTDAQGARWLAVYVMERGAAGAPWRIGGCTVLPASGRMAFLPSPSPQPSPAVRAREPSGATSTARA